MIIDSKPNFDLLELDLALWRLAKEIADISPSELNSLGISTSNAELLASVERRFLIRLASGVLISFKLETSEDEIISYLNRPYSPRFHFDNDLYRFEKAYWLKMKNHAKQDIDSAAIYFGVSKNLVKTLAICSDDHIRKMADAVPTNLAIRFDDKIIENYISAGKNNASETAYRNMLFYRYQNTYIPNL